MVVLYVKSIFLASFFRYHEDKKKCICSFATFLLFFKSRFEAVLEQWSETLLRQVVGDLEVKSSRFKSYWLSRPPSYCISNRVDPSDQV